MPSPLGPYDTWVRRVADQRGTLHETERLALVLVAIVVVTLAAAFVR